MVGWRNGGGGEDEEDNEAGGIEGLERWSPAHFPSSSLAEGGQGSARILPWGTTELPLPVLGNGGADRGQEAPAARQGSSAALTGATESQNGLA